jgi:hypothetical protein
MDEMEEHPIALFNKLVQLLDNESSVQVDDDDIVIPVSADNPNRHGEPSRIYTVEQVSATNMVL